MMAERSRWSESSEALRNGALNAEMLDSYYLLIDARGALEIDPFDWQIFSKTHLVYGTPVASHKLISENGGAGSQLRAANPRHQTNDFDDAFDRVETLSGCFGQAPIAANCKATCS